MRKRDALPIFAPTIQPAGIYAARSKIVTREDIEQIALVGCAALDNELEISQRAGKSRDHFCSIITTRDHLRDQRIEI